ncbi:MAG TPA: hypothetical protein PK230_03675, partial [Chitinophagales bacterium]|nr:hypothetical protein [Chitinophagales bacterium]
MKRNLLITYFFINLLCIPLQQLLTQGNNCQNADPFCTDSGASFPAGVNTGTAQGGNNYGCLQTQPNPAWYYLKILDPGAIHIAETNSGNTDIDFALWGPYNDLPSALNNCGSLPAPIDCSYSPQANEQIDIPNSSQQGDVFLLLLTNYANSPTNVFADKLSSGGGPGTTDCTIVNNCPPVNATAAANSPICTGGSINLVGTLDIAAPAGTTYEWTGPNGFTANQPNVTINNATPANIGTYLFSATAPNGCESTVGQVSVLVGQPVAVPSSNAPLCPGQQLQLFGNYTPSTLAGVTFTWTTPTGTTSTQQNPVVNNPVAGNYSLVVNYNGCQSNPVSINVTIANISPNIQSQNPTCSNPPFNGAVQVNPTGGGSPYSYIWSANAGVSNTTDNTASQLGAGTYTVTITASSGCTAVASATLQVPPSLNLIAATQNPTCFNGTNGGANVIASGGAGGYTYTWSNAATNNPTGNLSVGTYTVTVSDSGGCTASTAVTLSNPANFSVNIAPTNPNCAGTATGAANANVSPAGSYTYNWSNGAASNPANNIAAGNITVTVTNANGCTNTATNILTDPAQLSVSVTTQAATCFGANNG